MLSNRNELKLIIRVFDNGGKTWDRYTVVIFHKDECAVYGMSVNADAPNGFNQYCGSVSELPLVLDALAGEPTELGKEVKTYDLPKAVQDSIAKRLV